MKTLTVQPHWADAIIHGPKRVENRTWWTRYRGPLAIHAGQTIDPASRDLLAAVGFQIDEDAPRGAVIGVVDLVDVVRFDAAQTSLDGFPEGYDLADDPLATGPFCWMFRNPRPLREPIPLRGMPGLFDVDLDLLLELPKPEDGSDPGLF